MRISVVGISKKWITNEKNFAGFERLHFPGVSTLALSLIIIFLHSSLTSQAQQARELCVRDGLPNFFQKISNKDSITIGYLGGSITQAKSGWYDQSLTLLRSNYFVKSLVGVNAGVGGTGSDLGVFRLKNDILAHAPDLVFIEYALNDSDKPEALTVGAMEGIVRQVWQQNPFTDICFVYTIKADMFPPLSENRFPEVVKVMERVAGYYGIPTIHLGMEAAKLWRQGRLIAQGKKGDFPGKIVFAEDGVHPYPETGHLFYGRAIERSFQHLSKIKKNFRHTLKSPMTSAGWSEAKILSPDAVQFSGDWSMASPSDSPSPLNDLLKRFPQVWTSANPGDSFTVLFEGTTLGIYDIIGPNSGQYLVRIDDNEPFLLPRFDSYCFFYRRHYFLLDPLPYGKHRVTFTVASQKLDKQRIVQKRENSNVDNDAAYQEQRMYVGQILLVGNVIR